MPISTADDADGVGLTAAIRAARDGDEDAFRVLYRAIHPGLVRYLWAHAGNAAEDLAAETWMRVVRDLPRFRGDEAGFRGWVITIGRYRALDYARSESSRPRADDPLELLVHLPASEDTEEAVMEAMATADALNMISRLPTVQAEAVLLTVVLGLDSKTAGKVLGKRAGALRVAAHRGLRRLAEYLSGAETAVEADGAAGTGARGTGETEQQAARKSPRNPHPRVTSRADTTVKDAR